MIQPAFDIINNTGEDELLYDFLLMEVSEKLFRYVIYNDGKSLYGIRQYHLDASGDQAIADAIHAIISEDQLLKKLYKEAVILYNFPDSNLVAEKHFDIAVNKSITQLVFGNARKGLVLSEKIHGWNMYNVYRVPREIHSLLQRVFEAGKYWHYYTLLMSSIKNEDQYNGPVIKIIFYTDKFIVVVFSEQQLQLIQTYTYQTPEDVAYYLFTICRQFDFTQHDVQLKISGLIDEQSALYTELFKYFEQVQFEGIPATFHTRGLLEQFPPHYFSPLLRMALCV